MRHRIRHHRDCSSNLKSTNPVLHVIVVIGVYVDVESRTTAEKVQSHWSKLTNKIAQKMLAESAYLRAQHHMTLNFFKFSKNKHPLKTTAEIFKHFEI